MKVYSFHHQGKREYQEDSLFIDPLENLFIVCDGVGGHNYGSKASRYVVKSIEKYYNKYDCQFNVKSLTKVVKKINKSMHNLANIDEALIGMGTTIALVYINEDEATVLHVGDSRVYYKKCDDNKYWVTKDHSVVQELFDAGVISSDIGMKTHPLRNRTTRALYAAQQLSDIEVSVQVIPNVTPGDLFLLCSDGAIEDYTSDNLISHFSNKDITLESRFDIFKEHCALHSKDNNTSILIVV